MIFKLIAKILAVPFVADYLIKRAQRTPYFHLPGYMDRWWLFNGYAPGTHKTKWWRFPWSIRIHHILRADHGRDHHDHPWNARTFILKGAYLETRGKEGGVLSDGSYIRHAGDTASLKFEEFHRIEEVSYGGVWTLFVCGPFLGDWGFWRDGRKIPHRQYFEMEAESKPFEIEAEEEEAPTSGTAVTQWFDMSQPPVHVGLYERYHGEGTTLCDWWDGENFRYSDESGDICEIPRYWRGRALKAEGELS